MQVVVFRGRQDRFFTFQLPFRVALTLALTQRGAGEPADGAADGGVEGHDGAPGPVEAGVDALENGATEQDVHPGVQDLVPGGKTQPQEQVEDPEPASRQHSLCNKHLRW